MPQTKALELLEKIPFKLNERLLLLVSEAFGLNKAEKEALITYWKLGRQRLPWKPSSRTNRKLPEILDQLILLNQPRGFNFWESFQLLKCYKEYGAEKNFDSGLKQLLKSVQHPGNYDHDHHLYLFPAEGNGDIPSKRSRKKLEDIAILESYLEAFLSRKQDQIALRKTQQVQCL